MYIFLFLYVECAFYQTAKSANTYIDSSRRRVCVCVCTSRAGERA